MGLWFNGLSWHLPQTLAFEDALEEQIKLDLLRILNYFESESRHREIPPLSGNVLAEVEAILSYYEGEEPNE